MNILSIITIAFAVAIILFSLIKKRDMLSPAKVFIIVWLFVIGITSLKLSYHQQDWSIAIWLHILVGPLSFLLGTFFIYVINFNKQIYSIDYSRQNSDLYRIDEKKLFNAIIFLFFLFILAYGVILLKEGRIPVFASNMAKARRNFTIFGLGLFINNIFPIIVLTGIYLAFNRKKNNSKKVFLILLTIFIIIIYAMTLQRFQIVVGFFVVALILYYTSYKINYKVTLSLLLLFLLFFYGISALRIGETILFILYKYSKMKFSFDYAIFIEPYMYVAMNLENFANEITKLQNYTYGYYTFDFLLAISGLKHWLGEYYALVKLPYLITPHYNTSTAFWVYYRDFGILGIFLIPFLGGTLISTLYYKMRNSFSLKKMVYYGIFLYGIIFSFILNIYSFLHFVYVAIILLFIFQYITPKRKESN